MADGDTTGPAASAPSLWQPVLNPGSGPAITADEPFVSQAARLADLTGPALADHFLSTAIPPALPSLLDTETVRQSRLMNRFTGAVQRRWAGEIAGTGIPVVFLKGFAFAHSLYPDPDIRTIGDLDVLVNEADLRPLLDFLLSNGFRFEELPMSAWGFISDASFMPLMSEAGDCNIDVHIQPDCYPAYRAFDAADVFADAHDFDVDGTGMRMPSTEHALLLCLTNAAKDKFGPYSVRKLLDIVLLLRSGRPVDWERVRSLAASGHFLKPARVVFALMRALGLPRSAVPDDLASLPGGVAAGAFRRLKADYVSFFETDPTAFRVAEREFLLCTEPDVALHNAGLRLRGLFRRRRGLPDGYNAQ